MQLKGIRSPLHEACSGGHAELVATLIKSYQYNLLARASDGLTSLHVAALSGKKETVIQLARVYICPVDCIDNSGRTSLHHAVIAGHANLVQILVQALHADHNAHDK